jgi:hypothetical protein
VRFFVAIELQAFSSGDTDYVAKLNNNNNVVQSAINGLQTVSGATQNSSTSANAFFPAIFGTNAVLIGRGSYACVISGTTVVLAAGSAWNPLTSTVVSKSVPQTLNFAGQTAGTHYIVLDATGNSSIVTTGSGAFFEVEWDGSAITSVLQVAQNFWPASEEFSAYYAPTAPQSSDFSGATTGISVVQMPTRVDVQLGVVGSLYLISNTNLPAAPYTIDAAFSATISTDETIIFGVDLSDGSGHLDFAINCNATATPNLVIQQQGGVLFTGPTPEPSLLKWLRITEDGTTRKYYWSPNGVCYKLIKSEASGTFLVPTQAGLYFQLSSEATADSVPVVSVLHWSVANSILPTSR